MAIFIISRVNALNILICFKGFLDYLQPELFDANHIEAKSVCLNCTNINNSCFEGVYIRGVCAKKSYTKKAYINNSDPDDTCTKDNCNRKTYTKNIFASNIYAKDDSIENADVEMIFIRDNFSIDAYIKAVTCFGYG